MLNRLLNRASDAPGNASIFLHYPCFDGVISAVLAWRFVESALGWKVRRIRPVNYDLRSTWLQGPLPQYSAVVDFLYHPDPLVWADHHPTTFLTEAAREEYHENRGNRLLLYDKSSLSCAAVLWAQMPIEIREDSRYAEMVHWAERIDSASYESPEDAIFGTNPAAEINLSLTIGKDRKYCEFLLRRLLSMTLSAVANLPEVRTYVDLVRLWTHAGLAQVEQSIYMEHGEIAVFQATETPAAIVNRYSPYLFVREAHYSIGLVRSAAGAKITAMRNPWLNFDSIDLGKIFAVHGGGGHRRVASLFVPDNRDAKELLSRLVSDMQSEQEFSVKSAQAALG
jgi:hypothetical protein